MYLENKYGVKSLNSIISCQRYKEKLVILLKLVSASYVKERATIALELAIVDEKGIGRGSENTPTEKKKLIRYMFYESLWRFDWQY